PAGPGGVGGDCRAAESAPWHMGSPRGRGRGLARTRAPGVRARGPRRTPAARRARWFDRHRDGRDPRPAHRRCAGVPAVPGGTRRAGRRAAAAAMTGTPVNRLLEAAPPVASLVALAAGVLMLSLERRGRFDVYELSTA